jgi:hypothetical protein
VSAATRADRAALVKAIADLPISNGHIAFGRNGEVYEVYFREHQGSPAIWKVKASAAVDAEGYRSDGATLLQTGVEAVRQAVKEATGRTPSQIGISLGKWHTPMPGETPAGKTRAPKAPRKMSLIDAAVQVLGEAKAPMTCKQMVEQVVAQKLWSTTAATPHATLYSAILREIQTKGADARFTKVDRGQFALAKGA